MMVDATHNLFSFDFTFKFENYIGRSASLISRKCK